MDDPRLTRLWDLPQRIASAIGGQGDHQQQAKINQAFSSFDPNKQGHIDICDLEPALSNLELTLSQFHIALILIDLGSFEEDDGCCHGTLSNENFSRIAKLLMSFDLLDCDRKGRIEQVDIERAAQELDKNLTQMLHLFWMEVRPRGKCGIDKAKFVRYFLGEDRLG